MGTTTAAAGDGTTQLTGTGPTSFGGLTDRETVDLVAINAPLKSAIDGINTRIDDVTAAGGEASIVRLDFPTGATPKIALGQAGNGSAYPRIAGNLVSITLDMVLDPEINPVLNGLASIDFVTTGAGSVSYGSSIKLGPDIHGSEVGRKYTIWVRSQTSGLFWLVQRSDFVVSGGGGGDGDTVGPILQAPHA